MRLMRVFNIRCFAVDLAAFYFVEKSLDLLLSIFFLLERIIIFSVRNICMRL